MANVRWVIAAGALLVAGCAKKTDALHVELGNPVPDPFSSSAIALEIRDQRGKAATLVGKRKEEDLNLEGQDVPALVRQSVVNAFRRSGLSVPDQPVPNALPVVVVIDRFWIELLESSSTARVGFEAALSVQAMGQSKAVAEKFDAGAFGAVNNKRPFAKAIAKGMKRLEKQLESLGASLVKTSIVPTSTAAR